MHPVSGSISSPPGVLSPFPHGTGSLSVDDEYLALEDGPPSSDWGFHVSRLLVVCLVPPTSFRIRGYHPLWPTFPGCSPISTSYHIQALPCSLATTCGISVDFFSSGVLRCFSSPGSLYLSLCIQVGSTPHWSGVSPFGHLRIKALPAPPKLFAGLHVLRRLSSPRHPPDALIRLIL